MHNIKTMHLLYMINQIVYSFLCYTIKYVRSLINFFKTVIRFFGFLSGQPVSFHKLMTGF